MQKNSKDFNKEEKKVPGCIGAYVLPNLHKQKTPYPEGYGSIHLPNPAGDSFNHGSARSSPRRQRSSALHLIFRISGGKKRHTLKGMAFFGDPLEIRTPDPLLKRQGPDSQGWEEPKTC